MKGRCGVKRGDKKMRISSIACAMMLMTTFAFADAYIEANAGEEFKVTFNSNRTTGYEWQLAKPLDEKVIKFVSSEYKPGLGRLVGEPGKEIWTFKAVNSGKTTVYLKYVRPWEKDTIPANGQAFAVTVKEKSGK